MKTKENRNWMVLYTRSRWEKKVDKLLNQQNIKSFCPLVKRNRQWIDRKKIIEMPLFNSYLFINATRLELATAMQTSGVLTYISQGGKPATIDEIEIERIKSIVKDYCDVESVPLNNLQIGDDVKVKLGPLTDHEGEVQRIDGKTVIMILKNLNCALTVKIDRKDVRHKH